MRRKQHKTYQSTPAEKNNAKKYIKLSAFLKRKTSQSKRSRKKFIEQLRFECRASVQKSGVLPQHHEDKPPLLLRNRSGRICVILRMTIVHILHGVVHIALVIISENTEKEKALLQSVKKKLRTRNTPKRKETSAITKGRCKRPVNPNLGRHPLNSHKFVGSLDSYVAHRNLCPSRHARAD